MLLWSFLDDRILNQLYLHIVQMQFQLNIQPIRILHSILNDLSLLHPPYPQRHPQPRNIPPQQSMDLVNVLIPPHLRRTIQTLPADLTNIPRQDSEHYHERNNYDLAHPHFLNGNYIYLNHSNIRIYKWETPPPKVKQIRAQSASSPRKMKFSSNKQISSSRSKAASKINTSCYRPV